MVMFIVKYCKLFVKGKFIKDCVMKMVHNICPKKKQEFTNICLAYNIVVQINEDISSDIKTQLVTR